MDNKFVEDLIADIGLDIDPSQIDKVMSDVNKTDEQKRKEEEAKKKEEEDKK